MSLMIFGLLNLCAQASKSACESTINTNNTQNQKNIETETYPEPHRDPKSGKICIENCKLYNEDIKNYGISQAQKWVKQGRYNLAPEELEKQHKEYEKEWAHLYSLVNGEEKQKQEESEERKQVYQKVVSERRSLNDDCRKILLEAGYDSISLQYAEVSASSYSFNYPNSYSKWIVSAKKANEEYNTLITTIDGFDDAYDKIQNMTKGTVE